ncbi:MAG: hypothetical protein OXF79_21060 [Chloroflexi bacterium]|nr:hypothetical protein [Chloroflexota bacterium]
MTHWINILASRKLGGFTWWKSLGIVTVGVIMALGMGLRYGEPKDVWMPIAVVLVVAAALLWRSHAQTRDDPGNNDDGTE